VTIAGEERGDYRRLMLFFALVYIVEGMGQTGGLIAQPLNYFLKQQYGWTPLQVTAALAVLNLPWVINLAMTFGDNVGSFLFEHVFASRLAPLILASAAGTLIAAPFVPMLRLGGKRPGEAVAVAG
jgi:hypothetical protein